MTKYCQAILKSGKRKGKKCACRVKYYHNNKYYCGRHCKNLEKVELSKIKKFITYDYIREYDINILEYVLNILKDIVNAFIKKYNIGLDLSIYEFRSGGMNNNIFYIYFNNRQKLIIDFDISDIYPDTYCFRFYSFNGEEYYDTNKQDLLFCKIR